MEEIMRGICTSCGTVHDVRVDHKCDPAFVPNAFEEVTKDGVRTVDEVAKAEYEAEVAEAEKLSTSDKLVADEKMEVV